MAGVMTHAGTGSADQRKWLERFARFGYAARGFVYVLLGIFAMRAAIGIGGSATDTQGVLRDLLTRPFGKTILVLTAIGLAAYAAWRFIQSFKDADHEGSDAKGILKRTGFAISGVIHVGLAIQAARLATGSGSSQGGDSSAQDWTATLMSQPFGRYLAIAVGVAIMAFACSEFYSAWKLKFMERIKQQELPESTREGVRLGGRAGYTARGIVMLIIGAFVAIAAWHHNPEEARGMSGALHMLQQQAYGPWLMGIVGLGLLCFGLFQFVNARYRVIRPPEVV